MKHPRVFFGCLFGLVALVLNFVPGLGWRVAFAAFGGGFPPPVPGVTETFLDNVLGIVRAVPTDATAWQWVFGWGFTMLLLIVSVCGALCLVGPADPNQKQHPDYFLAGCIFVVGSTLVAFVGYDLLLFQVFVLGENWAIVVSRAFYALAVTASGFVISLAMSSVLATRNVPIRGV